ncbi:hypothetical protein H8959_002531 [Pygathrix nigripes]
MYEKEREFLCWGQVVVDVIVWMFEDEDTNTPEDDIDGGTPAAKHVRRSPIVGHAVALSHTISGFPQALGSRGLTGESGDRPGAELGSRESPLPVAPTSSLNWKHSLDLGRVFRKASGHHGLHDRPTRLLLLANVACIEGFLQPPALELSGTKPFPRLPTRTSLLLDHFLEAFDGDLGRQLGSA